MPRFLSALAAVALFAATAHAETIYTVGSGPNGSTFGSFDLATLAYTELNPTLNSGPPLGDGYLNALAQNGGGGFYSIQYNSGPILRTIMTDGTLSAVPGAAENDPLHTYYGISLSANGTLYAFETLTQSIGTISLVTGLFTPEATTNFLSDYNSGDIAFADGGTLYGAGYDQNVGDGHLYSINTSNGAITPIGATNSLYGSMSVFSVGADLYGINGLELYKINTATGTLADLGAITGADVPILFTGASSLVPVRAVPEPGSFLLVATGLGIAGCLRLRRTAGVGPVKERP